MRTIIISGATGFIGKELSKQLKTEYRIIGFGRWNENTEGLICSESERFKSEGLYAVIHLAGANVFARPWTEDYKNELRKSRIDPIFQIHRYLDSMGVRPQMVIGASAVGYYGNDARTVTETSSPGNDFLSELCVNWEDAYKKTCEPYSSELSILRLGVVIHPSGGAFRTMTGPFGLGTMFLPAGGNFPLNAIRLEDVVNIIQMILSKRLKPCTYNLCTNTRTTYKEFIQKYKNSKQIFLPTLSVPENVVRIFLGKRFDVLSSKAEVIPMRLNEAGYLFRDLLD